MLNKLQNWDGKSSEDISRIYKQHHMDMGFAERLFDWPNDDPHIQKGLSWLLKRHCDNGATFEAKLSNNLLPHLKTMPHWETALHILQSIASLEISNDQLKAWEQFIRLCLAQDNKFVRAWSYYAFAVLSRRFPNYKEEARQLVEMALRDEAPSVKARIRQMQEQGLC
ncbi:hypothetical protein [Pseudoteredinibacter isoporae]|uniref:Uncharacterized protein n=1 Tax=Pseudoteredinibacter isoporae TaxID=570281 RepID=A0A7X0MZK2_9GAMM|nr:hypothetical protein [Pseudoteredinibacter isoporae]MBB6523247.1 hypothetical protein [Pseudoteredinibacter isoporae]NHO88763.1 hypothetical protein [Pseudoteredinibacter isoporae]NIB22546.1 hypothetical protein [Pseudoteredinibacter isoporae]